MNRTEESQRHFQIFNFPNLITTLAILLAIAGWLIWRWMQPPPPFARIATLGYVESPASQCYEPFGIAADDGGNIYFSESITGRIFRIAAGSYENNSPFQVSVIAENLATPSAIAIDDDGNLIVANTGAHTIVRVDPETKIVSVIAGQTGQSGNADGSAGQSRFNAPVGVAVGEDGSIFVADTYNDSIRIITPDGQVKTLAGGRENEFDTPCGIAVMKDGSLVVADTGNNRIRRIAPDGRVTTIAGTSLNENERPLIESAFNEPITIIARDKESFFVADAGDSIRLVSLKESDQQKPFVKTELPELSLNRPTGLALLPDGELAFAESGSAMIRALIPAESKLGISFDPDAIALSAERMRQIVQPRWPFDPPEARREIAGTLGEIRGERLPEHDAWFHNGLDVPGAYGEIAHAIFTEPVTRPLSIEGAGTTRERIRLPLFGYIHVKIGRDKDDQLLPNFADGSVVLQRDEQGQIARVRVRRGTLIKAGDAIGALNRLNHVHLIAGSAGREFNALTVLRLPGLTDSVAPVIEAVTITDERRNTIFDSTAKKKDAKALPLSGRLRIFVRAYDQADGNAKHRRLGLYRIGYQVLDATGRPIPNFDATRRNLEFNQLPEDWQKVALVYAEGSQSGYEGPTIFNYIATNTLKRGEVREDFFDTAKLASGEYTLRVVAADYFGNVTMRDLPVKIDNSN